MTTPLLLPELKMIIPRVFLDTRGWFYESYSARDLEKLGITDVFVQDNHSFSIGKGTIRGLHYQAPPFDQAKLVRCTKGTILDVAVDIRHGSPNFARWFGIELSAKNKTQLYIPKGFAHGFLTLEDDCEVQYKVDSPYSQEHDRNIRFDDPYIGIEWGEKSLLLSNKDLKAPLLKECGRDFLYGGRT
jgi:dTDP-4-dehydrorhamnose 3,5-epimerase